MSFSFSFSLSFWTEETQKCTTANPQLLQRARMDAHSNGIHELKAVEMQEKTGVFCTLGDGK